MSLLPPPCPTARLLKKTLPPAAPQLGVSSCNGSYVRVRERIKSKAATAAEAKGKEAGNGSEGKKSVSKAGDDAGADTTGGSAPTEESPSKAEESSSKTEESSSKTEEEQKPASGEEKSGDMRSGADSTAQKDGEEEEPLRSISMADFDAALKTCRPSTNAGGVEQQRLNQWNQVYGDNAAAKSGHSGINHLYV